jgi:hypothetical protein
LPWAHHRRISLDVCAEFYAQSQAEKSLGLASLPFMEKDPAGSLQELAPLQAGFLSFVALPLWSAADTFAGGKLEHAVANARQNKEVWDKLADGADVPERQFFYRRLSDPQLPPARPSLRCTGRSVTLHSQPSPSCRRWTEEWTEAC